jgi:hypothetical protein
VSAPVVGAFCATHRDIPAVEVCTRCGAFACGDCIELLGDEVPTCAACAKLLSSGGSSRRAKGAMVLSALGMAGVILYPVFGVLSLAGAVLGRLEVRAIDRGEAGLGGKRMAQAAFVVGCIATALHALIGVSVLLWVWRTRAG